MRTRTRYADATLPGALRCDYAAERYFNLRDVVACNAARCPWLAAKILACRSGAPIPAAALAPDVTRHDVNWGAEGARRFQGLHLFADGRGVRRGAAASGEHVFWAQGAMGLTSGKHFFQVVVTSTSDGSVMVGFVDPVVSDAVPQWPGAPYSKLSGAVFAIFGELWFGTAPYDSNSSLETGHHDRPCAVGLLLDLDATPSRMTVFVDGQPLAVQCEYDFPKDRAWFPSVGSITAGDAFFSNAV